MTRATVFLLGLLFSGALAADPKKEGKTLDEYKAGKADEAEAKAGAAANDAKMGAVSKVTTMLEDVQKQVLEEGEKEAATYDKFACFCRDMTKAKTKAIKKGTVNKDELSASIRKLQAERVALDKKISGLNTDIEDAEKAMNKLKATSDEALTLYEKNEADLSAAISGVKEATKVLKASKGGSLLQIRSMSKSLNNALMLADALGLKSAQSAAAIFLQNGQAPAVEMEDYKFHSADIVETLEKLTADFTNEKNTLDSEEVSRVADFDMARQKNTDLRKAKNLELEESKESKDRKSEDIGEQSQELTTTIATLLDDQEYLSELSKGCSLKAKTWDQRSKVRVQELTAITEAMDIIKATVTEKTSSSTIRFAQVGSTVRMADAVVNDEESMEALEAEAEDSESAPVGFLQKRLLKAHATPADVAKQMVASLLKSRGMELKSTLLMSLSTQMGGPFSKIKKLIQELIDRLLTEAANEANQKGWCDKALADAKQKRDMSADKADELNAEMAKLEATRDKLAEELGVLAEEIKELTERLGDASKMRVEEKAENKETVYEAKAGLEAVQKAIQILSRFYATAAKETVDLSLVQASPFDDAPDAGFKTGEAYTAAGSDSGGIVGMMQVIESDFVRTIKETEAAEADAEKEHLEFTTESKKSLAEKTMAEEQKKKYKDEAEQKLDDADEGLQKQTDILKGSLQELMELQPACIDTGMSYADRVAMREQEIESLKKALCILGAYAKFGPDGLSDAC